MTMKYLFLHQVFGSIIWQVWWCLLVFSINNNGIDCCDVLQLHKCLEFQPNEIPKSHKLLEFFSPSLFHLTTVLIPLKSPYELYSCLV